MSHSDLTPVTNIALDNRRRRDNRNWLAGFRVGIATGLGIGFGVALILGYLSKILKG